jgi:hypothetical protein
MICRSTSGSPVSGGTSKVRTSQIQRTMAARHSPNEAGTLRIATRDVSIVAPVESFPPVALVVGGTDGPEQIQHTEAMTLALPCGPQ